MDQESERAFFSFLKDFKPEIRVHAGDNFDFRNLRRGASDDEKASSLQDDWEAGEAFLSHLMEGGKENYYLLGNHSSRLWDFAASSTGLLRDYANGGIKRVKQLCKKNRVKLFPYDSALGVLQLGHLKVLHGYHAGSSAATQHARVYGNCIFGHVHTQESSPVSALEPAEARSIGCMCIRDMNYINAKTGKLRWAQGWAYGYLFEDGTYQLFLTRKINGRFYVASEIKSY